MWSQLRNAGWRREPSGALRGGRARLVAAVVLSMAVVANAYGPRVDKGTTRTPSSRR